MALLANEDDSFELDPVEVGRSNTGSPLMGGEGGDEGFQIHRPREKKDRKARLTEESKKGSSLSLKRTKQKDKEPAVDKTPKGKGKQLRSKSGSPPPPDSPKIEKKQAKVTASSPNVKSTRKWYSKFGFGDEQLSGSEEDEGGYFQSNKAASEQQQQPAAQQESATKPLDTFFSSTTSPTSQQTFTFPPPPNTSNTYQQQQPTSPTRRITVQFPLPTQPDVLLTPERPGRINFQDSGQMNPLFPDVSSPGQAPVLPHQFFQSPFPMKPLQPSTLAGSGAQPPQPAPPTDPDWTISDELRQKCRKQFSELKTENGLLQGDKAREFFVQSRLPNQELSLIWRVADVDRDNALSEDEFSIAMKLVLMRRRGHPIPNTLPDTLLPKAQQSGLFTDSFVSGTQPQIQPQAIPPPPQHGTRRYQPPRNTQSAMELLPTTVTVTQTEESGEKMPKPKLSQIMQQSSPNFFNGSAKEETEESTTQQKAKIETEASPILVEIGDTSTSDTGRLVGSEHPPEGDSEEDHEPAVAKIISIGGDDSEDDESTTFFRRKRTTSEGSLQDKTLPKATTVTKPTTSLKPSNVRRAKSLKHTLIRPEPPPRPPPPTERRKPTSEVSPQPEGSALPDSETAPFISVEEPSLPKVRRSASKPGDKSKYVNLASRSSSSSSSPVNEEEEGGEDGVDKGLVSDSPVVTRKGKKHARSTSLDLKKMLQEEPGSEVHKDLPSAVPPEPPPKRHLPPTTEPPPLDPQLDKPTIRGRSASTGSITSTGATPTAEKHHVLDDHALDIAADTLLLGQKPSPPTKPKHSKKVPLIPPSHKPKRPAPVHAKHKPDVEGQPSSTRHTKIETSEERSTVRSKADFLLNIRSLKETNATLLAINKGLEEKLFKLMDERVRLGRELEMAQTAQHEQH